VSDQSPGHTSRGSQPPATKRRLRVVVPLDIVARSLGLKSGQHIVAFDHANDPLGVIAIIEGPDLPESPIGSESPGGWLHQVSDGLGNIIETHLVWPDEVQP
jgi:hypothetical protein